MNSLDRPLTEEEFAIALRKGLGRAAFHLRDHGAEGVEDCLADACLTSQGYDAQCEGSRGEWLWRLLEFADKQDVLRPKVLQALGQPPLDTTDLWTIAQLLDLARIYGSQGDGQMRQTVYDRFDRMEYQEIDTAGDKIIALDGAAGLLHVVQVLGARVLREPRYTVTPDSLTYANESLGETVVASMLAQRAEIDENVRAFLNGIEETRKRWASHRDRQRPERLDEVLAAIEQAKDRGVWLGGWGKKASQEDLAVICQKLMTEDRPPQLLMCLRVFFRREMPSLPPGLLKLAAHPDEQVRWAAIRAFAKIRSDEVRECAIRLLKQVPPCTLAIRMLAKNYREGDHVLLESVLPTEGDPDSIHGVVLDLTNVAAEANRAELATCLLWAYESSPCSECRYYVVGKLIEHGTAPEHILRECLFDCHDDTRRMARRALGLPEDRDWST